MVEKQKFDNNLRTQGLNYEDGNLQVIIKNSSMKKTEMKVKKINLCIRVNGFNHIILFFANTIYIFQRSDVVTELVLTLLITE